MTDTRRPRNLLFIFSDQHASRVMGCYGNDIIETPNLDRLAADGVTFDNAYCPSPLCVPSRMSMLTGRYPHRSRVWGNQDVLHSGMPTMAHALGAGGLAPVLIGRLHSVGPDQLVGYARRAIGDHHANWVGLPREDMGPLKGAASPQRLALKRSGPGLSPYEVKDDEVADETIRELERTAAAMNAGQVDRFAITMGFMLPHSPFVARRTDYDRYAGKVGLAERRPPPAGAEHPWLAEWRQSRDILDVTETEEIRTRTAYYGLVSAMDRMIGRVLDRLEALGLADDTLVVYASDHGEQLGEHGQWWKHTFLEDSVKVPLIMRWPRGLPAGERRDQVVNLVDVNATILDALGAPPLANSDGRSFLNVARDPKAAWRNLTFSEYCTGSAFDFGIGRPSQNRMVRDERYKLVYYHGMAPQLFDMIEDPDETRDLAAVPAHATVRDRLIADVLRDWDPEAIAAEIETTIADKALLKDWAAQVRPESTHVWPMKPEYNRLETSID